VKGSPRGSSALFRTKSNETELPMIFFQNVFHKMATSTERRPKRTPRVGKSPWDARAAVEEELTHRRNAALLRGPHAEKKTARVEKSSDVPSYRSTLAR
jgi:hypothetical protein